MAKKENIINEGGVNGTGEGIVNINKEDYKNLQKAVQAHAATQSKEERIRYELISLRLQMKAYVQSSQAKIIPLGTFLQNFIKILGIKNKSLAKFIDLEESNLSAILNNRRKINTELALILGTLLDIDPLILLEIQNKNELLTIQNSSKRQFHRYELKVLLKQVS